MSRGVGSKATFSLNASESRKRRWNYGEDVEDNIAVDKRQAFTPGWNKFLTAKEALPIKVAGKVVRTYIEEQDMPARVEEEAEGDGDNEPSDAEGVDGDSMSEASYDYTTENPIREKPLYGKTPLAEHKVFNDLRDAKQFIGALCCGITTDPEKSLSKKSAKGSEYFEDTHPRLSELIELVSHPDVRIVEMAMLSLVLVFKDICPSYRIRLENIDVQLKKDTKRKRDIEKQLLECYRRYITFLQNSVKEGLGDSRKAITVWTKEALFGLSAYRCQCELLRSLYHFNFRSILLQAVIARAAQPNEEIAKTCFTTVEYIFKNDTDGEVTFETVRAVAQSLTQLKYNVNEEYIRILSKVKLHVHANFSESIRKAAKGRRKKNKKKGKGEGDDAENDLLQAEATNTASMKRFQLDSLHEICLIYFRIIKNKIGYDLFPVALEGMGKVSHLVNIDTMEDLVLILKNYLSASSNTPTLVQLHCIHCALQVLSGPGAELEMDVDPFVDSLHDILADLSGDYQRWDIVLMCIDYAFLRRKEPRPDVIQSFVRHLFFACTQLDTATSIYTLATAHSLLVRYPNVRANLKALVPAGFAQIDQSDDAKVDLAMAALRAETHSNLFEDGNRCGDGSWSLSLLSRHPDPRYQRILSALLSREVVHVPLNIDAVSKVSGLSFEKFCGKFDSLFDHIPPTKKGPRPQHPRKPQQRSLQMSKIPKTEKKKRHVRR